MVLLGRVQAAAVLYLGLATGGAKTESTSDTSQMSFQKLTVTIIILQDCCCSLRRSRNLGLTQRRYAKQAPRISMIDAQDAAQRVKVGNMR